MQCPWCEKLVCQCTDYRHDNIRGALKSSTRVHDNQLTIGAKYINNAGELIPCEIIKPAISGELIMHFPDMMVDGIPSVLPCDVTIGVATFKRGTQTSNVLEKLVAWEHLRKQGHEAPLNRVAPDTSKVVINRDDLPADLTKSIEFVYGSVQNLQDVADKIEYGAAYDIIKTVLIVEKALRKGSPQK